MGCGMTVVRSALTSVLASDRFPSSVSFASAACFLPGKAGLPSTDQPAQGAEPLLREVLIPVVAKTSVFIKLINSSIHSLPLCQVPCQAQENSEGHRPWARELLSLSSSQGLAGAVLELNKGPRMQRSTHKDAQSQVGASRMLSSTERVEVRA